MQVGAKSNLKVSRHAILKYTFCAKWLRQFCSRKHRKVCIQQPFFPIMDRDHHAKTTYLIWLRICPFFSHHWEREYCAVYNLGKFLAGDNICERTVQNDDAIYLEVVNELSRIYRHRISRSDKADVSFLFFFLFFSFFFLVCFWEAIPCPSR